jgi:hypothetical protein
LDKLRSDAFADGYQSENESCFDSDFGYPERLDL